MAGRALFAVSMILWLFFVLRELREGRIQLLVVLASSLFFQLLNWGIGRMQLVQMPQDLYAAFINTFVSLLHSAIVGASGLVCCIRGYLISDGMFSMLEFESLYFGAWPGAYTLLAFSCGYFAYDQVDMIRRRLYGTSLLVHHLLLLNCFTLALFRRVTINYLILTLLCEVHSVFLHWRRVGRALGVRKLGSRSVSVEWLLNWFSFTVARVLAHLVISAKLYLDAARFPNRSELLLAATGMLGLNVLNAFLGVDLLRACSKELGQAGKAD